LSYAVAYNVLVLGAVADLLTNRSILKGVRDFQF
jgi:heme exporter protein D